MRKLLLIIFSIVFFSQSFAQHNIAYEFKVEFDIAVGGIVVGTTTATVASGNFLEGVRYIVDDVEVDSNIKDAYAAIVGSTFLVPEGALDNDIKLDITLEGLDADGRFKSVDGQTLFLRLGIDVYSPADASEPLDSNFWFNTGYPMEFSIPRHEDFNSFVTAIGLDTTSLAFAYIVDGTTLSSLDIETVVTADSISFYAAHLSSFGGGDANLVGVKNATPIAAPTTYALEQNYPNPFNPTTNINFSLPETGNVAIKIYNTLGAEITTLLSENMPAGNHVVTFNAANLPSGIYFYTMNSNNFSMTKKMLLLK